MWNQFRCAKRAADPAKTEDLLLTHDLFVTYSLIKEGKRKKNLI